MFFFFNYTATTLIYTLSLHDALPICIGLLRHPPYPLGCVHLLLRPFALSWALPQAFDRSEEHTSELQSLRHLVCRLLLEKKNKTKNIRLLSIQQSAYLTTLTISYTTL